MRQAGRYLQNIKRSDPASLILFLSGGERPVATLQPLRRFDIDAAIIFSDILMIWAIAGVHFVQGEGPKLNPLARPADVTEMQSGDMLEKLAPVFGALKLTRAALEDQRNLIGFCGAPWTVATYMIEGGGSRDFQRSREMLWQDHDGMMQLINSLSMKALSILLPRRSWC